MLTKFILKFYLYKLRNNILIFIKITQQFVQTLTVDTKCRINIKKLIKKKIVAHFLTQFNDYEMIK